ncbi:MAG: rod shape-determining protein MreD [Gammaproteobacteria bacterium]|nr:rod shape-determining protein MreD [Gammaproteobacteria bacterium]
MTTLIPLNTIRFIVLILAQVLLFSHINFLGYVNPYIYILFIAFYPVKNNRMVFMLMSFLMGLLIDMFLDTGGIHAAASVTVAYARPVILKFAFGVMYENQKIKFQTLDIGSKAAYISLLVLVHHFVLFYLEVFSMSQILFVLKKTLFSGIFTILLSILFTVIFSRKN